MNKRKRQHYVPQFYLKKFVREDNFFTLINLESNKIIENVPYKDQCYENYYYGADEEWEIKLSNIETPTAIIIRKIIEHNEYYPNSEELKILKEYILYQRYRTAGSIDTIFDIECKFLRMYLENQFENKINLSDNMWHAVKEEFEKREKRTAPKKTLETISKMINFIDDLDIIIVNYNNIKNKLISSDNPVIFYNIFSLHSIGVLNAGLIIMLPINPNKIIILFDSKMYPKYKNKKIVTLVNEKEVQLLNSFQVASAQKIVYFKDKNQALNIKSNIKNSKKLKKNMYGKLLTTEESKYINFTQPYIDFKYEFSFCKLHPRARKLNISDYEMITRTRSEMCEKIMIEKEKVSKNPELSGKISRKNVKDMKELNKFINDYWNDNL